MTAKRHCPARLYWAALAFALVSCGESGADDVSAATEPRANASPPDASAVSQPSTGSVPAQPVPASPTQQSKVIGKAPMAGGTGCRISFAYEGYAAEDILWNGEPCEAVSATLVDRSRLQELDKWQRLDDYAQQRIAKTPGQNVLLVEGRFTASIYPLDYNGLTYEVSVAD